MAFQTPGSVPVCLTDARDSYSDWCVKTHPTAAAWARRVRGLPSNRRFCNIDATVSLSSGGAGARKNRSAPRNPSAAFPGPVEGTVAREYFPRDSTMPPARTRNPECIV